MNILLAFPLSLLAHEFLGHYLAHYVVLDFWPRWQLHLSWERFRFEMGDPGSWFALPFWKQALLYGMGPYWGVTVLVFTDQWLWIPIHLWYSWSDLKNILRAWRVR